MYVSSGIFLLPFIFGVTFANEATRLYKTLFRHYGPAERATPGVEHHTDRLNTTFGLTVINIADMDTVNGIVTLTAWTVNYWTDRRLTWVQTDYNGVENIKIPNDIIWTPDTMLYNRLSANIDTNNDAKVLLTSNGGLLWIPPVTINAPCMKDREASGQIWICSLKFGSWTYDGNQFDMDFYEGKKQIDDSEFKVMENGWRIIAQEAQRNVKHYPCCSEPYIDLTFPFQVTTG